MKKILSFCAAMLVALAVNAADIYIAPDSPNAAGDNLRRAVRDANAGDVIILADGVYKEADQIALDKNITIQAADNAKPIIAIHWYCTLTNSAKVEFKGVTFAGNEMLYLKDDQVTPMGASDHCIRPYDGTEGKSLTFENCEFVGFPSYIIYPQRGDRCVDAIVMKNCYFHDNAKSAVYVSYDSSHGENVACKSLKIENSTFANFTDVQEALISVKNDGQEIDNIELVVNHCTFYNFVKNSSGDYSFIDCRKSTNVAISNCIFAQPAAEMSKATYVYGGSIDNCLIYNTNGHRSNSIVHNGIEGDPKFVDAANGNYTLAEGSPAIGAGKDGLSLGAPRWWPTTQTLYLKPGIWYYSGNQEKFAIYSWADGLPAFWSGYMTLAENETDIWTGSIRAGYDHFIFVRFGKDSQTPSWSDNMWNKTFDLELVEGKDLYSITGWGENYGPCPGEWSKYTYVEKPKFKIAGSMTNWAVNLEVFADSYTFENLEAGNHRFKVVDGDAWKGVDDMTGSKEGLWPDQDGNICFTLAAAGDVVVNYKKDELFTVSGAFVNPSVAIIGNFDGPWTGETQPIALEDKGAKGSVTKALNAGSYEFKVIRADNWLSLNGENGSQYTLHRDWLSVSGLLMKTDNVEEQNALVLNADMDGDYTFEWEYATGTLNIVFPNQGGGTGLDNTRAAVKAVKVMENGQMLIIKNGVKYNAIGTIVK